MSSPSYVYIYTLYIHLYYVAKLHPILSFITIHHNQLLSTRENIWTDDRCQLDV